MKWIYVCGPTVYDKIHLGNLRPIITYDLFLRANLALNKQYYLIHNITDIDDKIINKSLATNQTEKEVSTKYLSYYLMVLKLYNVLKPFKMPKVSDNISGIIDFIKALIFKKFAYEKEGNVFFKVNKIKDYGALSNIKLKKQQSKINPLKINQHDFAIWKKTQAGIQFASPWGFGRPGWHTECAFFVAKYLKEDNLDYHGGGMDLKFPHHENENAQYQALFDLPITKKWKHTGLIKLNQIKMSKSLQNVMDPIFFKTNYGVDTLRLIFLSFASETPINFSNDYLLAMKSKKAKIHKAFIKAHFFLLLNEFNFPLNNFNNDIIKEVSKWNFSQAIKKLDHSIKDFNSHQNVNSAFLIYDTLIKLGFYFTKNKINLKLIDIYHNWKKSRENLDFKKADKLRNILIKEGII